MRWRPAVVAEQERAPVRVTAHAFGLAGVCRVWWAPKVKSRCLRRALYSGGRPLRTCLMAAARDCSALSSCVGALRLLVAVLLVVAMFRVPRRVDA